MTPFDRAGPASSVAVVAGGSRGLGLLIARELGARGYRLAVCARDAEELARARADLAQRGYKIEVAVCDVADPQAVQAWVADIETRQGEIGVVVCVAGVIQVGPLESVGREQFETAMNIMAWGPINVALAVLPAMRARRSGRIGVISSVGGLIAVPHLLPYSTAKFAALGFSRGLRAELAGTGVSVTTVAPGLMRTGSHLRARFVGRHGAEYAWFSAAASLPGLSMNAERAAAAIVDSVLAGRAVVVLTGLAKIGMWVNGLFPNLTALALGVAARLLPKAPDPAPTSIQEGKSARDQLRPITRKINERLTSLGDRAASRNNE